MSSKPIKVLHVIGSLGLGGAQICVKYISESSNPDIENYVYPLRSLPEKTQINSEIIKLPYPNYDPRKFLYLVKFCKKNKIDILHAHLTKPIIGCLLASFFCRAKVIVHEHGPVFRRSAGFPGYRLLMRILKRRAEIFIAVSKATAEKLKKTFNIPSDRIQVVYNAVDTEVFDPGKYIKSEVRKSLSIDENVTVLGFVGRLSNQKGIDLVIRALPLLKDHANKFLLLIVGDGPKRKSLERLACELGVENNIRFMGFYKDVARVISSFDIGLVPSRFEPFGMVAIEFMRMKIPVITSGIDGLGEFITNEHTGLITDENSPNEIARCVERILSEPELRQSMIESAFKKSEEFGISKYVDQIYNLYTSISKP